MPTPPRAVAAHWITSVCCCLGRAFSCKTGAGRSCNPEISAFLGQFLGHLLSLDDRVRAKLGRAELSHIGTFP